MVLVIGQIENEGGSHIESKKLPRVSIVIVTYNRGQSLTSTLEQLFEQNYPKFEIIIVDKTEEYSKNIQDFLDQNSDKIRHFRRDANMPESRNIGIKKARGDVILFVDDDVKLKDNEFVTRHAKSYTHENVHGVVGKVAPSSDAKPLERPRYLFLPFGFNIVRLNATQRGFVRGGRGCNMSFRKEALLDISGFDENFTGDSYREEADVFSRLRKKNYNILFEPKAEVIHPNRDKPPSADRYKNEILYRLKNFNSISLPVFILFLLFRYMVSNLKREESFSLSENFRLMGRGIRKGFETYQNL